MSNLTIVLLFLSVFGQKPIFQENLLYSTQNLENFSELEGKKVSKVTASSLSGKQTLQDTACTEDSIRIYFRRLCESRINKFTNSLNLNTIAQPTNSNGTDFYYFVFYHSFNLRARVNAEYFAAQKILDSFEKSNLTINKLSFTGVLKLAVPFTNAGISSHYSGYNLWVLKYKNGELLSIEKLMDVDIISENSMVRPT